MHEIEYIHVALICNYAVLGYVITVDKNNLIICTNYNDKEWKTNNDDYYNYPRVVPIDAEFDTSGFNILFLDQCHSFLLFGLGWFY